MPASSAALNVSSRLAWNTATKWLSSLLAAVVAIYLVRYQRLELGQEGFGAVSLLTWIVVVMLLCDGGLRAALGRHVAEQIALGNHQRLNELFNSSLAFVLAIGAVLAVVCLVAAEPLVEAMNFAPSQRADAIVLVRYFVSASVMLSFVAPTFGALIEAYHRFDVVDFAHLAEVLLRLVLMVLAIGVMNWGIYGWAFALLVAQVVLTVINVAAAFRVCPALALRPRYVRRDAIAQTISLGGLVFLYQSAIKINDLTDPAVISRFLSSNGQGFYRPAQMAVTSAYPFVAGLSRQMKPLIAAYDAQGEGAAIREVLLRGTRLTILLSTPFCVMLTCFAFPIVRVWLVGDNEPTAWVLMTLALADVSTHVRETQGFVMTGLNRVRFITIVQLIGGLLSVIAGVVCTWWLYHRGWGYYSIIGVAMPAVVAGWTQTLVISVYVGNATGLGAGRYLLEGFSRPLIVLVLASCGGLALNYLVSPDTLASLIACTAIMGVICAALGWTIGFDAVDRARVQGLLNRFARRVRAIPPTD
ncbi:MAG: hypothetical protein K2Y37_05715 [Pirellulales bacterium]|nr:hypothetical protein [Pirellulales bacterium]